MNPDGGDYLVAFCIDHADVRGSGVDNIDFVLARIRGDSGRRDSDLYRFRQLKRAQINDRNRVAFAVRDVGVLVVSGVECGQHSLVEIPPSQTDQDRCHNQNQQDFSHRRQACGLKQKLNRTVAGKLARAVASPLE